MAMPRLNVEGLGLRIQALGFKVKVSGVRVGGIAEA